VRTVRATAVFLAVPMLVTAIIGSLPAAWGARMLSGRTQHPREDDMPFVLWFAGGGGGAAPVVALGVLAMRHWRQRRMWMVLAAACLLAALAQGLVLGVLVEHADELELCVAGGADAAALAAEPPVNGSDGARNASRATTHREAQLCGRAVGYGHAVIALSAILEAASVVVALCSLFLAARAGERSAAAPAEPVADDEAPAAPAPAPPPPQPPAAAAALPPRTGRGVMRTPPRGGAPGRGPPRAGHRPVPLRTVAPEEGPSWLSGAMGGAHPPGRTQMESGLIV